MDVYKRTALHTFPSFEQQVSFVNEPLVEMEAVSTIFRPNCRVKSVYTSVIYCTLFLLVPAHSSLRFQDEAIRAYFLILRRNCMPPIIVVHYEKQPIDILKWTKSDDT